MDAPFTSPRGRGGDGTEGCCGHCWRARHGRRVGANQTQLGLVLGYVAHTVGGGSVLYDNQSWSAPVDPRMLICACVVRRCRKSLEPLIPHWQIRALVRIHENCACVRLAHSPARVLWHQPPLHRHGADCGGGDSGHGSLGDADRTPVLGRTGTVLMVVPCACAFGLSRSVSYTHLTLPTN